MTLIRQNISLIKLKQTIRWCSIRCKGQEKLSSRKLGKNNATVNS